MDLVTEHHRVIVIDPDGSRREVAVGDLVEGDEVWTLRRAAVRDGGETAGAAFDRAFDACEALPGDGVAGEASFEGGMVRVERRIG